MVLSVRSQIGLFEYFEILGHRFMMFLFDFKLFVYTCRSMWENHPEWEHPDNVKRQVMLQETSTGNTIIFFDS